MKRTQIIFLDLDGTLTDTAHQSFKGMKDGLQETIISSIPLFPKVKEFVKTLKENGHIPIIVSDSHPKYVKKIASTIFKIDAVSLTDKPNTEVLLDYIQSSSLLAERISEKDDFIMIGDSWLDIELGRRLNIRTVLTKFYKASSIEERDGIGQDWKPIKAGPTYYAKNYDEILDIIDNPIKNLLAIEAIFQNENSSNMVKFYYKRYNSNFTAFRCLARQEDGECDRFARADKYKHIDNKNRTNSFLETLAKGISNYLKRVSQYPEYKWDILTYVSDKRTTSPSNKMKEIFDLVESKYLKKKLFEWNKNVEGKLRQQPNYDKRRSFIGKNLFVTHGAELKDKSVIILDDQFTSSATAQEICSQLRDKGAKNILFIALFYLILPVESKSCPKCSKPLKIKIRKSDGNKFYSCVSPKYGGSGCGYIENIKNE